MAVGGSFKQPKSKRKDLARSLHLFAPMVSRVACAPLEQRVPTSVCDLLWFASATERGVTLVGPEDQEQRCSYTELLVGALRRAAALRLRGLESGDRVLVILNTSSAPPAFYAELARHPKWGQYYGIRLGLAGCPQTPVPIALSALVQLRVVDLDEVSQRQTLPEPVRAAAKALKEKEKKGLRRVVRSPENDVEGGSSDSPESIR